VLRRVVKDHSDIKNPAMMRRAASVWHLKENGIIRARCVLSAMPRRIFYFFANNDEAFTALMQHAQHLQIDRIFLSFLLSPID